jgi:hypothetical protein
MYRREDPEPPVLSISVGPLASLRSLNPAEWPAEGRREIEFDGPELTEAYAALAAAIVDSPEVAAIHDTLMIDTSRRVNRELDSQGDRGHPLWIYPVDLEFTVARVSVEATFDELQLTQWAKAGLWPIDD